MYMVEYFKKYKKQLLSFLGLFAFLSLLCCIFWFYSTPYNNSIDKRSAFYVSEDSQKYTYARATVKSVGVGGAEVRLDDGRRQGDIVNVVVSGNKSLSVGDRILVGVGKTSGVSDYMTDFWRLPGVMIIASMFILLVVLVGGKQGFMSMAGLVISIIVVAVGLVPAILNGADAFWSSVVASYVIATLAILTAHGLRWRTVVSLMSIYLILALVILFALLGGWLANLTGVYDDTSILLKIYDRSIDVRGILIGGIIIATLGVLDDIVTAQTAAIDELHKAQPRLLFKQLFSHGFSVGREHVAALVNTLALAYVGVSLPLILSIVANFDSSKSILMLFNSEFISQEVVRTLISSMALVIAVPISTALATFMILRKNKFFAILKISKHKSGGHNAAN